MGTLKDFVVRYNEFAREERISTFSKGDLMKMAYGETYRNVDSALPMGMLEEEGISEDEYWHYVMDYNNNGAFGRLTDLFDIIEKKNPTIEVYNDMYELTDTLPILDAVKKYENQDILWQIKRSDKSSKYAKGSTVKGFKKGDKVKTREGNIETVIRVNSNGNIETQENNYTHNPQTLELIPKHAKGSTVKGKSKGGNKIESYLPIFNGFYNTLFEANEEMYIEDTYDYDDYEFNYKQYHLDVAKECVGAIEQELNHLGLGISIKFQALDSPREYNFRNDRIDVEYTLGADSLNKIHSYLLENKNAFSEYVKDNYTSRSGFYSFHSNNVNEWLDNIKNGTDLDHKLGAVLNFILQNENYTDSDLYDRIIGNVYLEADLKESSKGKEYAEGGNMSSGYNYSIGGL
jgi:hypothetical protein